MLLEMLLSIAMVLLICQRWSKRDVYKLGKQLNSGIWTLPFLGHSYLFIGDDHTQMKALQILGRDAIRNENGLTSVWHGNYLYTIHGSTSFAFLRTVDDAEYPTFRAACVANPNSQIVQHWDETLVEAGEMFANILVFVIADPGSAEVGLKTCLNKDDLMQLLQVFIGNGTFIAPVPIWRQRRKFVASSFNMKNLKYFMTIFERESATLVQNMEKMAGSGLLSAFKYYTAYTMDTIAESTMGYKMGAQKETKHPLLESFDEGLRRVSERLCKPWLHSDLVYHNLPFYSNLMKRKKYVDDFMTELIENKRKEITENNITQEDYENSSDDISKTLLESLIMLSGQDEGFTNDEIREELLAIMAGGTDTSAVVTSFTSLMFARHPQVQEKVYEELQEVFGDSNRPPTFDDIPRFKYLDAVIRETLRLYPPAPVIIRKVEKDVLLPCGIKLVPGTGVVVNIWALHRNPRYWGDDAELFRPERFIDTPLTNPAAFMPFSYGPRNCVGNRFAMISLKTVLSSVLRRYKILPATAPNNNSEYPPIRLKFDLTMKDEEDFPIRLESRC